MPRSSTAPTAPLDEIADVAGAAFGGRVKLAAEGYTFTG
jgi:hypothetical protein